MSAVKTKITINERQNLSESDIGGIYVTSNNGRIVCNNTLSARLEYSTQKLLPEIRHILFSNEP
jgi:vacuolar-type H+-ATPase subunit E/Vma4